jgi:enolase
MQQTKSQIISDVNSRQVLDSRGNPTVEVEVWTEGGFFGRGTVPSGASTGVHEALELRDNDEEVYGGKGVLRAVSNVKTLLAPKLLGRDCTKQRDADRLMIELDGTKNKSKLGANAILGTSMALARAASASRNDPLYHFLEAKEKYALPVPMMNVINGGKHAGNKLAVQEFHIEPVGAKTFSDSLRMGVDVYHALKRILKTRYGESAINVGDEGGYAPPIEETRTALDAISHAVSESGYTDKELRLGIDAASSSFYNADKKVYSIDGRTLSSSEMHDYYASLVSTFPILTIEDPFSEDDYEDFAQITRKMGAKVKIIGDDLYVTNTERIKKGIEMKATNAILIKLNQIGTVSETFDAIKMSRNASFCIVVSHRSGETEDTFISHLATAAESEFIKTGAPARGERTAKYNELLRIEEELGPDRSSFAGTSLN